MSMTTELAQRMKAAALKFGDEQWQTHDGFSGIEVIVKGSMAKGRGCVSYQPVAAELADSKTAKAIALFNPANIKALVEALEAAQKQIADKNLELFKQSAHIAELTLSRKNAWKQASAARNGFDEQYALREAAEKRNAELNSTLERWAMDRAQSASELEAAEKRVAELEAREVVLPQRYSMLHRTDFDEPYHTEMVYKQHQVLEALHDAGIRINGEG